MRGREETFAAVQAAGRRGVREVTLEGRRPIATEAGSQRLGQALLQLATAASDLQRLKVHQTSLPEQGAVAALLDKLVPPHAQLRSLALGVMVLDPKELEPVAKLTALTELRICRMAAGPEATVQPLRLQGLIGPLTGLVRLALTGNHLAYGGLDAMLPEDIHTVATARNLQCLELHLPYDAQLAEQAAAGPVRLPAVMQPFPEVAASLCSALAAAGSALHCLDLGCCLLNQRALEALAELPQLQELSAGSVDVLLRPVVPARQRAGLRLLRLRMVTPA